MLLTYVKLLSGPVRSFCSLLAIALVLDAMYSTEDLLFRAGEIDSLDTSSLLLDWCYNSSGRHGWSSDWCGEKSALRHSWCSSNFLLRRSAQSSSKCLGSHDPDFSSQRVEICGKGRSFLGESKRPGGDKFWSGAHPGDQDSHSYSIRTLQPAPVFASWHWPRSARPGSMTVKPIL